MFVVASFEIDAGLRLAAPVSSFPHVFSVNPGKFRTGPPIKRFGGDDELGCRAHISSSVGERKIMNHFVVKAFSQ